MSLYVTPEDRANMEKLLNALLALGHDDLRDKRGNPSHSAMVRYLVKDALHKLGGRTA
jgi:hypothetical protein